MDYLIRLEQLEAQPLAVVRRRATLKDLPKVVPAACGLVWSALRAHPDSKPGRHVSLYLDTVINLEVGVEVAAPFAESGEVVGSATPSGLIAATTHFGPYQQLHGAHEALRLWCTQNGYERAGPFWEVYGHWKDEWNNDPALIRTDVFYLLCQK